MAGTNSEMETTTERLKISSKIPDEGPWSPKDLGIRMPSEEQEKRRVLQGFLQKEMLLRGQQKKNMKKAAEASVTEAGNLEEAEELGKRSERVGTIFERQLRAEDEGLVMTKMEEQILLQKQMLTKGQKKKAKKAAEASVTEAGNLEEAEEELGKRSERVGTIFERQLRGGDEGLVMTKMEEQILLQKQMLTKGQKKNMKKKAKKAAEASVTEAGNLEEAEEELGKISERVGTSSERQLRGGDEGLVMTKMEEQILLQKQMLTKGQKKKMKKKAKKAAEASVTEAGNLEEAEEELGKRSEKEPTGKLVSWVDPVTQVSYSGITYEKILEIMKLHIFGEAEAGRPKDPASNAPEPVRVFEDAEYHGAKFESLWNRLFSQYCAYDETTTIPAMRYTHGSDSHLITMDALQVFSVKVASTKKGIRWPLQVFGIISARDVVDRKRNIIFHRERDNCQTITEQDPYLTLTGPSRAVLVSTDPSYVEVVLKVKGATERKDKELSRVVVRYRVGCCVSGLYPAKRSTLELRFGLVAGSVEATVHVRVTGGSWPVGFKGVFSARADSASTEGVRIRLLDVGEDGLPVDAADGGMIRLSRRVVSVQKGGMLKVFVSAKCYAASGSDEEHGEACFVPAKAGVSSGVELKIGSCRMEATVAWSLFSLW